MSICVTSWWLVVGGYTMAVFVAAFPLGALRRLMRCYMRSYRCGRKRCRRVWKCEQEVKKQEPVRGVPAAATGIIERLVFVPVTAISPTSAVTAMGGWIAMKLAANWQRNVPGEAGGEATKAEVLERIRLGFLALLLDLLSMFVAATGGYVVGRGIIVTPPP